MISTGNDPLGKFRGHHDKHKILSHAQQGDGATVWQTMSKNSMRWNPEQNFGDDKNNIHLQCRKNVKLVDDVLKERLQSVSLVVTTLLTSLHDTTTENLNKGFKVAVDSLEKIANSTERILGKVEQILETLADSPQVIVLITVSGMVLIASILSVLIGMHNIKLTKAVKTESKENTELISKLFSERWDRAEAMFKTQARENNASKPKEPQATSGVLTLTVENTGLTRDDPHERSIRFR